MMMMSQEMIYHLSICTCDISKIPEKVSWGIIVLFSTQIIKTSGLPDTYLICLYLSYCGGNCMLDKVFCLLLDSNCNYPFSGQHSETSQHQFMHGDDGGWPKSGDETLHWGRSTNLVLETQNARHPCGITCYVKCLVAFHNRASKTSH